ncbi:aminopeptidase P family protein [Silvimonas iriomotensis]|uniref:Aminopeptidase n=1 Tax=Silvimonas iriomotensis TaxID=449662 RepID=A0ABQ2P532_9NEIS|nr:aminopeptidase P family protein [Silvimonas iriomotensis]GGP18552.1 aminopeptidase [Silvimonas iriomotensis]
MSDARQTIQQRVSDLRAAMRRNQFDAWIIPSADPHLSEYLPDYWQGRKWASGFTGSVGTLVVTDDFAGVWVDGRYWEQAEAQLEGTGVKLMKLLSGQAQPHVDWLAANLKTGARAGADGDVLSLSSARATASTLQASGVNLATDKDLLSEIWADRPTLPQAAVYEHVAPYAAVSRAAKLAQVRAAMQAAGAQWHFVSTLDDLAWIFNLRGGDVDYNPVFLAHALIGADKVTLFVDEAKISADLKTTLAKDGVEIAAYDTATTALAALPAGCAALIDPARTTLGLINAIPTSVRLIEKLNPSQLFKSRKTDAEIAHVRDAMAQDGAALCEFFSWLDRALNKEHITELDIDSRITAARAKRPGFVSASFGTIAGFNQNGALPHYHATPEAHSVIKGDGLLLIDSGGQYTGGTTDITRVVPVGNITADHRRDFTTVLKGVIALSRARFPLGIRAAMIDAIARAPMWAEGVDYNHGTGHGVGYFLNVHEGPQSIGYFREAGPDTAMQQGMITSIEPGIYRPGRWGIRIENLVVNQSAPTTEFGDFLEFETLTLCPIDTRCVERSLLTQTEADWLNQYHATVRTRLQPLVSGDALAWLLARTEAI